MTSKRTLKSLLSTIQLFLADLGEGIIESHTLELGIWAEFIASKLNFSHVMYLLAEPQAKNYYFYPGYKFFIYKLNRSEFYGTTSHSLSIIFNKPVQHSLNNFVNIPFDDSELAESCLPELHEIDLNSFVIGTICRLEKSYVIPLIESCISVAKNHPSQKFTLIVGGGSEDPTLLHHLEEKYNSISNPTNLTITFTGYITILGKNIFKLLDVFVGQGTAAINAISQKCATLIVEPVNNKCSGIFGLEVNNFGYSETGVLYSIQEKLESLLIDSSLLNRSKTRGFELFQRQYSVVNCFNKLDNLITSSVKNIRYYPFSFSLSVRIWENFRFLKSKINTAVFKMSRHLFSN